MAESDGSTVIRWVRSEASGGGSCVEVGIDRASGHIAVRQSKDPAGPALRFSASEWEAFLTGVGAGEFTVDKLTE